MKNKKLTYEELLIENKNLKKTLTEKHNVENALHENEIKFNGPVNYSTNANHEFSNLRDGLFWLSRAKDILGFSPKDVKKNATLWNDCIHPEDKKRVQDAIEDYEKGYDYNTEYRIKTKKGKWLRIHDYAISKTQIGYEIINEGQINQITERKNIEQALLESELKYKQVTENIDAVIWRFDLKNDKWLYVSPQAKKIVGYLPEEWLNFDWWVNILHPDDRIWAPDYCIQQTKKHQKHEFSYRVRHKNGNEVWIHEKVDIELVDGKPAYLFGIMFDITEQKLAEQKIKESEAKITALLDAIPDIMLIQDSKGVYLDYHAPKDVELYVPPEMFLGKNMSDIFPSNLVKDFKLATKKAIQTQLVQSYEYALTLPKGLEYFDSRIIAFDNDKILCTIRNITDKKLAEILLKANEEKLSQLNADKDRFMTILAHDLRSPLSTILSFSELLVNNIGQYKNEEVEKYINIIHNTSISTFNLLDNILLWSQAQSGKMPFEPQKINFSTICQPIIDEYNSAASKKNITIQNITSDEIDISVDINMFNTTIRNLISNAIKFTNKGGSINISAVADNLNAIITISDNGLGIEPKKALNLFKMTQINSTAGTEKEKGTGIGLLICKDFVEKQGGKIWVESVLGKGSDFKFTVPLSN